MDNALFPAEPLPLFRPYSYKWMYCGRGGAKSWAAARLSSSRVAASYSSSALVKLKTPRVLAKIPLCQLMVKGGLVALAGGSRPR